MPESILATLAKQSRLIKIVITSGKLTFSIERIGAKKG